MANSFSNLLSQPLAGRVVLVRVDFNVPLVDGVVSDDTRIKASLPTINALLKAEAKVVLLAHLKRPDGQVVDSLRLNPIRDSLEQLLQQSVHKLDECVGDGVQAAITGMANGQVLLLENIRFYAEEMANDASFSDQLADCADYFVQDAFGVVHRAHASTVGVAQRLPSFSGVLLETELRYLGDMVSSPARPFVAIVGGSKISTKLLVLKQLIQRVDSMVLGGAMVYTLLKAKGVPVGASLVEDSLLDEARLFLDVVDDLNKDLYLPVDHRVVQAFDQPDTLRIIDSNGFADSDIGIDIGPASVAHIETLIQSAKSVFWNGPVGVFETKAYANGTNSIAQFLAESDATTIVGGGDSIAAINQSGYADRIHHISTGGGASLEFLEGKILPGISVLQ